MDDPDAEDTLLLFIENTLECGKNARAGHEKKSEMDMERREDRGREHDRHGSRVISHQDPLHIFLHNTSRKEFLDPRSENINDLPQSEAAQIDKRRFRLECHRIDETGSHFDNAQENKAAGVVKTGQSI